MRKRTAFDGAYRKGEIARELDIPRTESPYLNSTAIWTSDNPRRGAVTWVQIFQREWLSGWDAADKKIKDQE